MSWLVVSIQKTAFYSSGLSSHEISSISILTGIPRNSKKLTILNCEPLLNQRKSKVNTWSESLSFAGRLLLVNTVIAGITNLQLTDEEDTYV
ncbi:unnamed protein product [Brassica rapa]|uniref:Uncharacterized protein n=1 Tax=Brassica campestris TaxID=3711 RepID=A0A3P6ALP1_BRACM|nr:unnamed protein product [Brassica rapa]CAG7891534.1 unnamed protein product [Brassica rapa]VDC71046.1 unnamed protein product [Brassica rapa]VDC85108.1 unnamed protein product [Brassica rapa]